MMSMRFAALRPVLKASALACTMAAFLQVGTRPVSAQRDPEQAALTRCSQELQNRMSREFGGRRPEAVVDQRDADVRRISDSEIGVRGGGRYSRDQSDRGQRFTFDCVFGMRSGNVTRLDYKWSDGGGVPAPPPPPPPRPGGGYGGGYARPQGNVFFSGGIVNRMSNKGLDVQDRSTRNGANVQQWGYGGEPNQRWELIEVGRGEYGIISVGSGKALEVADGNPRNGANVEQYQWNGAPTQRWRLEKHGDFYEVINIATRKCLDVQDKNPRDGANIQQWDCSGADNQAWRFQK
jgi:Ricin-type beta-trefoil lectin domain-like